MKKMLGLPLMVFAFVMACVIALWPDGRDKPHRAPAAMPDDELPFIRDEQPRTAGSTLTPTPMAAPDAGPAARDRAEELRAPVPAPLVAGGGPPHPPHDSGAQERSAGSIDKDSIRHAIQTVKPLIRQCFEDAQHRFPPPQKVTLSFTIVGHGISGHFDEGEIKDSTIVDPWVQSCFLDSLSDVRFPIPEGGGKVTVTYPFSFTSGADKVPASE